MSTSYNFDLETDFPNQKVNPDILAQQLEDAGLASGGTFEGVMIEGGVPVAGGVIDFNNPDPPPATVAATVTVTWQNALDPADDAAQAALIATHQGDAFGPVVQRKSDEGVSSTASDTFQVKVSATALPLPAGKYLIAAYCEIRMAAAVANSGVRARVIKDAVEVAEDNWGEDQWHAFSGAGIVDVKAGETPMLAIEYRRIGAPNTVEIRRARMSISQQSD
jgi:hypothetical protein